MSSSSSLKRCWLKRWPAGRSSEAGLVELPLPDVFVELSAGPEARGLAADGGSRRAAAVSCLQSKDLAETTAAVGRRSFVEILEMAGEILEMAAG